MHLQSKCNLFRHFEDGFIIYSIRCNTICVNKVEVVKLCLMLQANFQYIVKNKMLFVTTFCLYTLLNEKFPLYFNCLYNTRYKTRYN